LPSGNQKPNLAQSCEAGRWVEATLWFNRQGQAHIVSTALRLRTWFSIDPQPASISPTINISIVFICAFPVDSGRIICHPAIKNDLVFNPVIAGQESDPDNAEESG
jgi:hypothetical protein